MTRAFPVEDLTPVRRGQGGHLYEQIRDQIAAVIATHQLPAGTQLPVENVLVERLGAGRLTIRAGIQALEAAGLVEPRHGVGVFVRERLAPAAPDVAVVQRWVLAVDEIIAAAAPELQAKYLEARQDLPDWALPA